MMGKQLGIVNDSINKIKQDIINSRVYNGI